MGILCAFALTGGVIAAYAEDGSDASADGGTQLFLPTSYEQYLDLKSPSDFAVNDDYIAIADGSKIYLYDKSAEKYEVFSHTSNVSSLNFYKKDGKTYLYFAIDIAGDNPIQYIDCSATNFATQDPQRTDISSSSNFIIYGDQVCFANASNSVYLTSMNNLNIVNPTSNNPIDSSVSAVSFAVYDGNIYYSKTHTADNAPNVPIHTLNLAQATPAVYLTTKYSISSFAIIDGTCYFVSNDNFLYRQDKQGTEEEICSSSLIKYFGNGNPYLIIDKSVCEYSVTSGFTGYEIGKYSKSETRLGANAAELSVYNEKLLIADTENNRILSYNKNASGVYGRNKAIATKTENTDSAKTFSPELVCAGETSFLASDGSSLCLYSYDGEVLAYFASEQFSGKILDCTYSFGTYYFVTIGNSNACALSESDRTLHKKTLTIAPTSISSDIFGNLYVYSAETVYRFTAQEFTENGSGTLLFTHAGSGDIQIATDFCGNIYLADGTTIYRYEYENKIYTQKAVFTADTLGDFVYNESTDLPVLSFAFGFENGDAFILSDGFIVKTDALSVRSLTELDAEGVYGNVFSSPSQSSKAKLFTAKAGAVTVGLDLSELSEGVQYLPYHGYERLESEKTGVVLAETDDGTIVAFYDRTDRSYSFALVLSGSPAEVIDTGVQTSASGTMYTVSEIGLYKYPLMLISAGEDGANRFESIRVGRSHTVKLLAKISHDALDAKYYFVSVTEGGTEYFGFLPVGYLSDYNSAGAHNPTEFRYARIDKGESCVLKNTVTGEENIFENREKLKVFDKRKDENGNVYVIYEGDEGTYTGYVDPDILYEATPAVMVTLVIVTIAAAAIIVSVCYLLLRKQPTLQ